MKWINDSELDDFIAYVNNKMQGPKEKPSQTENKNDNLEQIKQLKELLDMEAITQEEFDLKKKQLLNL